MRNENQSKLQRKVSNRHEENSGLLWTNSYKVQQDSQIVP